MRSPLWSVFLIMLVLAGCGWDGTPTRNNDFTKLTSIEITAISSTIAAQTSTKLAVVGNFSGIFTRDITDQVTWSSADPTIAGFTNTAVPNAVTGQAPGTVVLTATVGNISNTFTLTVSNATVTAMALTPVTPSLPNGLTQQFVVTGTFSDASTQDLTLDATWASSDTTIATVSDAAGSKGLAQAKAEGQTTISATFGGTSAQTVLTVTAPVLQSLAVSTATPSLLSLTTGTFQAAGVYSDGTSVDVTSQVAWSSGNTNIAKIETTGTVTALSEGNTTISAGLSGVTGSANLKVTGGHLTSISITTGILSTTLVKGTRSSVSAKGAFSDNSSRDITGLVNWSTSNSGTATVTPVGSTLAWLDALGVTLTGAPVAVTAQYGSLPTATTNITITAPGLSSLEINTDIPNYKLVAGTSGQFKVTAHYDDLTTQDVTASCTWTTSDATIAKIGNKIYATNGRVTGVAAGTATITASYGGMSITSPNITITAPTLQSLSFSGGNAISVKTGSQVQALITANYSDSTGQIVTEDVTWSIDKPSVATLADKQYKPGLVSGVDTGTATLSASFGGVTQTATITVQ